MNIEGVVRPLALFDPPIDPGMLVKAAAAGIDIGSIVSGLNQPAGPVGRGRFIAKALELCGDVQRLGSALLAALEQKDAEHLALVRQTHEINVGDGGAAGALHAAGSSREEQTQSLNASRDIVLERYKFFQKQLGLAPDPNVPRQPEAQGRRRSTRRTSTTPTPRSWRPTTSR